MDQEFTTEFEPMEPETDPEETIEEAEQDPLLSLLEETRAGNEMMRRQLNALRWVAIVLAVLVLVLGACGIWIAVTLNNTIGQVDFAQLSAKLSELNIDSLNQAVQSLEAQIRILDVEAINEALAEIGGAAKGIEEAMASFNAFGDAVGGLFGR